MAKPFIKWVGGKRQLMESILQRLPSGIIPWTGRYFEPFLGGGAVFFELQQRGLIQEAVLNDYNEELFNLYQVVQQKPLSLAQNLNDVRFENSAENHQNIRGWDREKDWTKKHSNLERATRFIFLNRTSFNGLWRVNAKNQFNVPFGRYKSPGFPTSLQLQEASSALRHATLLQGDFERACKDAKAGDFVYFDPPYIPLSTSSSFTSYTDAKFEDGVQERLATLCNDLTQRGVKWMLSNSSAPRAIELFGACENAKIHRVQASRMVNSDAQGRGKVEEILVTNYLVPDESEIHPLLKV